MVEAKAGYTTPLIVILLWRSLGDWGGGGEMRKMVHFM